MAVDGVMGEHRVRSVEAVVDGTIVPDGRRARRERNRAAVVAAVLELLEQHGALPSTEAIAEHAGVSVSSVFRYFDDLSDLQQQVIDRHFDRNAALFELPRIGSGRLEERVGRLVEARVGLYRSIAPIARFARARGLDHPLIAQRLAATRSMFADQVRVHFGPELRALPPARADDLVALVDSLTSFESWDLLRSVHGRSDRQIRRGWTTGLASMLVPRG